MGFILMLIEKFLFFVGFVGGSSFPKPLSPQEEKDCIELMKNGDEEARKILIEHNLRLVAHIAKKYSNESNFDDLVSIGTIGLIKGVNTYNPEKNTKLAAYAARCIENEILMTMRRQRRLMAEISLDETIGCDSEGNNMTLSDTLATGDDVEDEVCFKMDSAKLYASVAEELTEPERKIICWRYGIGNKKRKTQQEVSDILGISRSYVSRIEKKAVKKLRNRFESGEKRSS